MKTKLDIVIDEITEFTNYKPEKGSDMIWYLHTARELANYYDNLEDYDDEEKEEIGKRIKNILNRTPFYHEFHTKKEA